jgi:hypothetical protein
MIWSLYPLYAAPDPLYDDPTSDPPYNPVAASSLWELQIP